MITITSGGSRFSDTAGEAMGRGSGRVHPPRFRSKGQLRRVKQHLDNPIYQFATWVASTQTYLDVLMYSEQRHRILPEQQRQTVQYVGVWYTNH